MSKCCSAIVGQESNMTFDFLHGKQNLYISIILRSLSYNFNDSVGHKDCADE